MRAIISAVILAGLVVATSAAGLGLPPEERGTSDACADNNAAKPFSCFAIGDDSTPRKLYIDTGRADGWPGIWEEDNTFLGLQKAKFLYEGSPQIPDVSLLG